MIFYFIIIPSFLFSQNAKNNQTNLIYSANFYCQKGYSTGGMHGGDNYDIQDVLKGINYFLKGIEICEKIDNFKMKWKIKAMIYRGIGFKYRDIENYPKAIEYQFLALEAFEKCGDISMVMETYSSIAVIYSYAQDYVNSLKYALKSIDTDSIENYKPFDLCKKYGVVGNSYLKMEMHDSAIYFLQLSTDCSEKRHNFFGNAINYNQIAQAFIFKNNLDSAEYYAKKALTINKKQVDKIGIAWSYSRLGQVEFNRKNYNLSIEYYIKAIDLFKSLNKLGGLAVFLKSISKVYEELGNYKEALKYYIEAKNLEDSLVNKNTIRDVAVREATYNFNKEKEVSDWKLRNREKEIALLNKDKEIKTIELQKKKIENEDNNKSILLLNKEKELKETEILNQKAEHERQIAISKAEKKKQKIIIWSVISVLLLIIVISIIIFRSLRITRKQKNIIEKQKVLVDEKNFQLNQQNEEIRIQRDLVTQQKEEIEHIHEEQTGSIRYAERIQRAVLPHDQYINERIPGEFFILFRPRDIVSGDFYFVEKRNNWLLITVADCTGHGVPGAFMSMLGISFLNEIIAKEETQSASHVLDKLRNYVIHSLQQKGVQGEQQDGMDIAFIALNTETNKLQFAGANNPLYLICTNNQNELTEIKGDKMPIGIYGDMSSFTNNTIQVNKGDNLYIFSDGFIDQFGGENRKKFLSKRLKETLLQISHLPMSEQRESLNTIFENWKGKGEQIDDVTVMGIRIS